MKTMWQEHTTVEWLRENAIRDENGLQVALHKQQRLQLSITVQVSKFMWLDRDKKCLWSMQWFRLTGAVMFHQQISSFGKVFISTHQWAPCSWCRGPYFWERWPQHTPPCRCLSSVTQPGWEDLSPYAQQPGYTLTTDREKAGGR